MGGYSGWRGFYVRDGAQVRHELGRARVEWAATVALACPVTAPRRHRNFPRHSFVTCTMMSSF